MNQFNFAEKRTKSVIDKVIKIDTMYGSKEDATEEAEQLNFGNYAIREGNRSLAL